MITFKEYYLDEKKVKLDAVLKDVKSFFRIGPSAPASIQTNPRTGKRQIELVGRFKGINNLKSYVTDKWPNLKFTSVRLATAGNIIYIQEKIDTEGSPPVAPVEILIGGPRRDHGYSKKEIKAGEKAVMKIVKKFKGSITDVTDKGSAIAVIPADKVGALERHMFGMGTKGFELAVRDEKMGGFDDISI